MKNYPLKNTLLPLVLVLIYSQLAVADPQDQKINSNSSGGSNLNFFATVNGVFLTKELLDLNLKSATRQGQKNSPELQKAIKEELINREVLAQQAERMDLAQTTDLDAQYMQLRQTLLIQALVDDHFKKHPITDKQLREEYDRQRNAIGNVSSGNQYLLSEILVQNEPEAIALIDRINKGEGFGKLAEQYSIIQGAKASSGQLGWVYPSQVPLEISQVIAKMNKGSVYPTPIKTQNGWAILKIDDKRSFKLPSYEEAKPQLRQALVQQYLIEMIKDYRDRAQITQ